MKPNSYRTGWRPAALAAVGCLLLVPAHAFAGSYWYGFKRFWGEVLSNTTGVVGIAIVVGLASLFIITRGKWGKS